MSLTEPRLYNSQYKATQAHQLRCLKNYRWRIIINIFVFYRNYACESQVLEMGLFLLSNGLTDKAESDY